MPASSDEVNRGELASGHAPFANTQWSVVLSAADKQDPRTLQSLESLCRAYWQPLYSFARRQGESAHDAQDLTQEFFARLLEKDYLASVDKSKGRFRSFLLAAFKHFLSNERDKARAQKRGGGHSHVALDFSDAESRIGFQVAAADTPEKVFERNWALALLDQALTRLRREYTESGKAALFEQLKGTLTGGRSIAYAELSARLGISEAAVKMAVHRLKQRYREVIRFEIAQTVGHESEVEDELRHVMQSLSA
jgi:RNA polymerase sigma factor (sigma-70 family)